MAEVIVQVCSVPTLTASIENITVIESASGAVSPTVSITAIEGGHRVTVTDASGTQSFDVLNGADGHTPELGVDYFTEADKADIAALVIADIGSAEEGAY